MSIWKHIWRATLFTIGVVITLGIFFAWMTFVGSWLGSDHPFLGLVIFAAPLVLTLGFTLSKIFGDIKNDD